MEHLLRKVSDDRGATLVEYALLIALIAVACIAAVQFLGGNTSTGVSNSGSSIFGAAS